MMKLPTPQREHRRWGRADYFDKRHKDIFLKIAQLNPSDVLYDLGCGNASLLIYATKKRKLKHAVGFENMPSRVRTANKKIKEAGLKDRIEIKDDFYDADFSEANVIFDMMLEGKEDFKKLYSNKLKKGTRVIKHNLPLIGYLPDNVVFPFYMIRYPFKKARTKDQWAREVMKDPKATIGDLWYELYYY
ncbi:MAG: SAM-dependent methyltransferase [Thaumarchaeota archaeon]|nr:SAM-dependent methyltransferase [Nitrososphaerota archaeon]